MSAHVTESEIREFFDSTSADAAAEQRVRDHLEACDSCRHKALETQRHLVARDPAGTAGPDCATDEALQQVAAGIERPDAQAVLDHAAGCRHCADRLGACLEAFSGFETPESAEWRGKLRTASPGWADELARKSLASAKSGATWSFWPIRPAMAVAGVAAVLVIAALLVLWPRPTELQRAQQQLAAAYGQQRTMAMRLPSFPHAEYRERRVTRAPGDPEDYPPAFREVQRLIAEQAMNRNAATPEWEHVRAKMDLLAGTSESLNRSVKWLDRALAAEPQAVDLQIELAAAIFEKESLADTPNLSRAIELLTAVLARAEITREQRLAALYNLAVAYEKTEAWDLALAQWEEYVRLDPDSAWGREARRRAEAARQKVTRAQARGEPTSEERLDLALRNLLPAKVSSAGKESQDAAAALDALSADLLQKHNDSWLRDFLAALTPGQRQGAEALAAAVAANGKGEYAKVLDHAARAQRIFTNQGNPAGAMRAEFEQVYAYHRFLQGKECATRAEALQQKIGGTRYSWLRAQVAIEAAICLDYVGKLAESEASFAEGLRQAEAAKYEVLALRSLGTTASTARLQGDCVRAWTYNVHGLRRYWAGHFPPIRLYQFYFGMQACGEQQRLWHTAEAFMGQAVRVISSGENQTQIGAAVLHHATLLTSLERDAEAERELARGKEILNKAPQDPTVATYQLIGRVTFARLMLRRARADAALTSLAAAASLADLTDSNFVSLNYYRTLGDTYFHLKQWPLARAAFAQAIRKIDSALDQARPGADRLRWLQEMDGAYRGQTRTLLAEGASTDAFYLWQSYRARMVNLHPRDRDMQRIRVVNASPAAERTVRLTYVSFADGVQLWLRAGPAPESFSIPIPAHELKRKIDTLASLCARPDSDLNAIRREGAELYRLLIGPVSAKLKGTQQLVIETDGPLSGFPFELLVAPDGKFVSEAVAITYSPGMMFDEAVHGGAESEGKLVILDAAPQLPGRSSELSTIQSLFPRAVALHAPELTRETALRELQGASILHFVGHGRAAGSGSTLMLSERDDPGAALTSGDLQSLAFRRLRLAVLAACSTGETDLSGLLNPDDMASALLRSGTPTVIASQWNVDSAATSRLIQVFYHEIAGYSPPDIAMHIARARMQAQLPHPFYWGGFIVMGKSSPLKGKPALARSYLRTEE